MLPPRQAAFYNLQTIPVINASSHFVMVYVPGQRLMPARSVYVPDGVLQ